MCLFVISYNQKREKSTHSKSRLAKSEIPLEQNTHENFCQVFILQWVELESDHLGLKTRKWEIFGFQISERESTWRWSEPEWGGRSGSAAMQAVGQAAVAGGRECG